MRNKSIFSKKLIASFVPVLSLLFFSECVVIENPPGPNDTQETLDTLKTLGSLETPTTYDTSETLDTFDTLDKVSTLNDLKEANNILFVLDVSTSMNCKDVYPDRLLTAKTIIYLLLDQLDFNNKNKAGFIIFGTVSSYVIPPTCDKDYLLLTVSSADSRYLMSKRIGMWVRPGEKVYSTVFQLIERIISSINDDKTVIVFLTDGHGLEEQLPLLINRKSFNDVNFKFIGIGTSKGAYIPRYKIRQKKTPNNYLLDRKGNPIFSRLETNSLNQLAKKFNGSYTNFNKLFSVLIQSQKSLASSAISNTGCISKHQNTAVSMLIDVSSSMLAEDLQPNRLECAKNILERLINSNPSWVVNINVFAGHSQTTTPFTTDSTILNLKLNSIRIANKHLDGTNLSDALGKNIRRVGEEANRKAIIMITDALDNTSTISFDVIEKYALFKQVQINIIKMSGPNEKSDNNSFIRMCENTGGKFINVTSDGIVDSAIVEISNNINNELFDLPIIKDNDKDYTILNNIFQNIDISNSHRFPADITFPNEKGRK